VLYCQVCKSASLIMEIAVTLCRTSTVLNEWVEIVCSILHCTWSVSLHNAHAAMISVVMNVKHSIFNVSIDPAAACNSV